MEEIILDEVRRDILERPKPTIDLEYLYSIKKQVQDFADNTNSQLKRNVYQNYSLFIDSSREISTLKEEMRELNFLLEEQQTSMGKLLDQLNRAPIIHQAVERPKTDPFKLLEMNNDETSEMEAEMLPSWFTKSPEDFDVLIAQRNLREAVELAQKVKLHFEQYPKCCDNNSQSDLRKKIETRIEELINSISSELQPAANRSVQGGPRSSVLSIQLLRELGLSSRAVKLYLDFRSSLLWYLVEQQNAELQTSQQAYVKQTCSVFFQTAIETCNEFKVAFEVKKLVNKALEESVQKLDIEIERDPSKPLFDLVRPIYFSDHPSIEEDSPSRSNNFHDITSTHSTTNNAETMEQTLGTAGSRRQDRNVFSNLSTYSSLTYWIVQEFVNFVEFFRKHVFNNTQLSLSMIADDFHQLKKECLRMTTSSEIDMTSFIDRAFTRETEKIIEESGRKLIQTIDDLNAAEQWQPQQFQNKAQLTRFFDEMNEVELKTMKSYMMDNLKLHFTASKTSFARCFLLTVNDLAKVGITSVLLQAILA